MPRTIVPRNGAAASARSLPLIPSLPLYLAVIFLSVVALRVGVGEVREEGKVTLWCVAWCVVAVCGGGGEDI